MSIYSFLVRNILLPIAEHYNHSGIHKELKRNLIYDYFTEEQLLNIQNERLKLLIEYSYLNVPYYTKLFDKLKLKPSDITCREDLKKLPILTKQIIRDNFEDLKSKEISKIKTLNSSSGGSTGIPLKFIKDINTWNMAWASTFRAWNWYGLSLGDKIFTFGGNSLVKNKTKLLNFTSKEIFDHFIMRNYKRDCSNLSEEAMDSHYKYLMKVNPKAIRGYPSAIYYLAQFIKKNNLKRPNIKVILTTGEMLLSQQRLMIQNVFRVPIYDSYGAGDGGIASHECYMHEGLHISEERCIIEILDSDNKNLPDGEVGSVISTDLGNFAFPFIRYEVGDLSYIKKEKCSCGRSSRLFGTIVGRSGKVLINKQGKPYTSIIVDNMMFKNMDYHKEEHQLIYQKMDKFQVYQDINGDILIRIVPKDRNESLETFKYLNENFSKCFPNSKIELQFVEYISPMKSGKLNYVVSDFHYK
ncbi:MAG TPA: hypothetical protein PK984_00845 [Paludibacteraceae bacterium]|nr:hypothetical protein [Paludibacteraceae bacterium]HOS36750.1 hypothetical protein [Paludibacteraceae bacterium]